MANFKGPIGLKRTQGSLAASDVGGSLIVGGDLTLTGWGTGASAAIGTGSTDRRGSITVTAGTSPSANPTVKITFKDGAFAAAPVGPVAMRGGGTAADLGMTMTCSTKAAGSVTFLMVGTPTNTNTYEFYYLIEA